MNKLSLFFELVKIRLIDLFPIANKKDDLGAAEMIGHNFRLYGANEVLFDKKPHFVHG